MINDGLSKEILNRDEMMVMLSEEDEEEKKNSLSFFMKRKPTQKIYMFRISLKRINAAERME